MALTDLLSKEAVDKISKDYGLSEEVKSFSINPESSYERDEFVERADSLFDLREHYSALRQNINDMSALEDVVGDIQSYIPAPQVLIPNFYQNPHEAIAEADKTLSKGEVAMAKFVEKNRKTILDKLDAEQLFALFRGTPSYTTGNPEYDRFGNLKKKFMQMQEAEKEGRDVGSLVAKEVEELVKKAGKSQAEYIQNYQHLIIPALTKRIVSDIQKEFSNLFKDKDGNRDKNALIKYLEENYKVVEDEMDEAEKDKDKYSLWDKNLKPAYLAVAQVLLGPEKKAMKEEKEPEREKWKKEVKAKGMMV